jgi:hypothetical protein
MQFAPNPALIRVILVFVIFLLPQLVNWLRKRNAVAPAPAKPSIQIGEAMREALKQRAARSGPSSPASAKTFGIPGAQPPTTFGKMNFPDSSYGRMPKAIEPERAPISLLLLLALVVAIVLLVYRALA